MRNTEAAKSQSTNGSHECSDFHITTAFKWTEYSHLILTNNVPTDLRASVCTLMVDLALVWFTQDKAEWIYTMLCDLERLIGMNAFAASSFRYYLKLAYSTQTNIILGSLGVYMNFA